MIVYYAVYANIIRAVIVVLTVARMFKHDYKTIPSALVTLLFSLVPWVLTLLGVHIDALTASLYVTVVFMALFVGSGLRWYDRFAWWDRLIHGLAGIAFFGIGVALAAKAPDAGRVGALAFGLSLSLALHTAWEALEYISDRLFHTDHQRWQSVHTSVNHLNVKVAQPAGLADTMNDALCCIVGAVIALGGWWLVL